LALPAVANADYPHVVSQGETLSSVAAQDGLPVSALAAANGISPNANLIAGMVLQIPPKGVSETPSTASRGTTASTGAVSMNSTSSQGAGQTGSAGTGGGSYVVRPGDTLSGIAAQAGTTVGQLAAANGISRRNLVVAGTTLTLPGGSSGGTTELVSTTTGTSSGSGGSDSGQSGSAGAGGSYVVKPGDTLSGIAAQAGTTVGQLAAANGISHRNFLLAGTTLTLPGGSSGSGGGSGGSGGGTTEMVSTTTGGGSYVVRPGDTLSGIAAQAGTTVGQLAAANGISNRNVLLAGMTLTLPGGATSGGAKMVSATTGTSSVSNVPTTTGSGGPPYPTSQYVSASEIASIAASEGVPAPLAEAIAWQESGWNNSVTSNVGAVGVMQIVPNTWQWIGDHLATVPLQPASASDNVRAGVLLLHALLAQTGSYSMTAAGYYQGLASIRRNGIFPSTQQYVDSVMSLVSRFGG